MSRSLLSELIIKLKAVKDPSVKEAVDKTKRDIEIMKGAADQIKLAGVVAGASFAGVSMALVNMGKAVIQSASEYEYLKTQMTNVNKNAQVTEQVFERLRQVADASGKFTTQQLVYTYNAMENLSKGSSELIPALAGLAETIGTDVKGAGEILARVMEGDSGRAFMAMERQLGITESKLKAFDSSFDKASGNIKTNADIIRRYILETFGPNLEKTGNTAASSFGSLGNAVKDLQAEWGKNLLPVVKEFADAMTRGVKATRDLMKAANEYNGKLPEWYQNLMKITSGQMALNAAMHKYADVVQVIKKAQGTDDATLEADAKLKAEADNHSAYMKFLREEKMSAEELGKAIEYVNAMKGLVMDELVENRFYSVEKYRSDIAQYDAIIKKIQEARETADKRSSEDFISKVKLPQVEEEIKEKKRLLDLEKLDADGQKKLIELLRNRATMMEYINGDEKEIHRDRMEANKLARDLLKDETDSQKKAADAAKAAAREKLDAALDWIKRQRTENKMSEKEEIAAIKRVLKNYEMGNNEKRRLLQQIAQIERDIIKQNKQEFFKAEKEKLQAVMDRIGAAMAAQKSAESEIQSLQKEVLGQDIEDLEKKLASGEDVQGKIQAKIEEKTRLELEGIAEVQQQMEAQGVRRETIEAKVSLLKRKAYRDEVDELNRIIDKLQEADSLKTGTFRPGQVQNVSSMNALELENFLSPFKRNTQGAAPSLGTLRDQRDGIKRMMERLSSGVSLPASAASAIPQGAVINNKSSITVNMNVNGEKKEVRGAGGVTAKQTGGGMVLTIPDPWKMRGEVAPLGHGLGG
jgi:hypothetical protein